MGMEKDVKDRLQRETIYMEGMEGVNFTNIAGFFKNIPLLFYCLQLSDLKRLKHIGKGKESQK